MAKPGRGAGNKGKAGEREIARALNKVVNEVRERLELEPLEVGAVQRNTQQAAIGGYDLTGCFGLAIEVKRQEALSINKWWGQACEQAYAQDECPVLLYRQSRKPWRAVMWGSIGGGSLPGQWVRCELGWDDFLLWFGEVVERHYKAERLADG